MWLGGLFKHLTFWTISRLFQSGFQTTIWKPFDNQTQIYHLNNTRLVWYSDGYCMLWLTTSSWRVSTFYLTFATWTAIRNLATFEPPSCLDGSRDEPGRGQSRTQAHPELQAVDKLSARWKTMIKSSVSCKQWGSEYRHRLVFFFFF